MTEHKQNPNEDNLVTERDTDPKFGLFREDSFPDSGTDEVQKRVIENELPRDNQLSEHEEDIDDEDTRG